MTTNAKSNTSSAIRKYATSGYVLIAIGLGGFLSWAALTDISAAVFAPGNVAVSSNRKVVQHLEGGIVETVKVRDGTSVAKGDVLVALDATRAKAELQTLRDQYTRSVILESRLTAEKLGNDTILYPLADIEGADTQEVGSLMEFQTQLFQARRETLKGEMAVLDSRVSSNKDRAAALERKRDSLRSEIRSYEEQLAGTAGLTDKGAASKNSVRELERRIMSLQTAIGETESDIAVAESAAAEADLQKVTQTNTFREAAIDELSKTKEIIAGLRERIAVATDILARTEIRAPQSGVIQGLQLHAKGAVVSAGEPILELVPTDDDLVIEAMVSAVSIDQVAEGMSVEVKFPSFNSRTTPMLFGRIKTVSADAMPDKDGQRHSYKAVVEVLKDSVPEELARRIQPGMVADVVVSTEPRSVLSYLVRPLSDTMSRGFREE